MIMFQIIGQVADLMNEVVESIYNLLVLFH